MTGIQVTAATPAQRAKAIEALVVGFAANPTCRWIWPDLGQYMTAMPQLIEALAGRAFDNGTAYVDQDVRGAALWLAPDTEPDQEAIAALIERTIDPVRLEDVGLLFAKLEQYHPQNEPCWYLPFIAVEPFSQNKGIGDALMRHA
ncbi:MAG: GNAT family N-acetyltransferase, partial [Alphaproteobacteria bacterium]